MLSRFKNALGRRLDDAKDRVQSLRGQPAAAPPTYRPPVDLSKVAPKPSPVEATPPPVEVKPPEPVAVPVTAPIVTAPVVEEPVVVAPIAAEAAGAAETQRKADEEAAAAKHAEGVAAAATKKADVARKADEAKKTEEPASLAARALALAKGQGENKMVHADMGSTDLEHYIARAKANGRDLSTIKGGVGLNKNDDGSAFWGPVDNTSSRAKAEGKMLTVDQWECISCGTCVEQTDKVFYLPADGKATPIAQDGPMDLIEDAIEACPVTCIHWVTPDEAADRGLATGLEADSPRPE